MDVRFVIVSPANRKAEHAVKLPVVVGRSDEAKFRVQQDSVSRRHCELFIKDDAVFVRDLGSTNGTILDGERIASPVATRVPPGAQIRVGGIVFRVEYESAAVIARDEPHGDDTVPMAAVHETPESRPGADAEAECLEAEPIDAAEPAEEPAAEAAGFGFLGAAPEPDPAAGGDDKLDDFFKSLK
jgi:predicted component of type VI protein secretion system